MGKLYLMYSGDTVFYATENNGRTEIRGNCVAKIGEWFLRFIENDTSTIEDSSIFTRESPYGLLEYEYDKESLKEHYKGLLDIIFGQTSSLVEMLKLTDIFKKEYKVRHSTIGNTDGSLKISRDYAVENLPEALSVELILLLEHGILLKKCENCNRYFFPKDNTEKYCDRPISGDKTCKDVGYINKMGNDELLKLYNTAYKTKHAQKQRKTRNKSKVTIDVYENAINKWRSNAKAYLKEAQEGKITINDFKKILNKELEAK